MPVPATVTTMRGQIREALKLAIVDAGIATTVLALDAEYGAYADKTKYPLFKVWSPQTLPSDTKIFGAVDTRNDRFMVAIAPWCTSSDYEDVCDGILSQKYATLLEAVRSQMDTAYAPYLGKIDLVQGDILETSITNPRAIVQLTFAVDYRLT